MTDAEAEKLGRPVWERLPVIHTCLDEEKSRIIIGRAIADASDRYRKTLEWIIHNSPDNAPARVAAFHALQDS